LVATQLSEQWVPVFKLQKGFVSATFFGDASVGEYMGLSLWESKEDAEAAIASTESAFQEHVATIAVEPPTRTVYEVWQVFEARRLFPFRQSPSL
jgi:hypothetical protein